MNILYDGDQEVLLGESSIMHELTTRDAAKFYQMTLIYRDAVKEFLRESNDLTMCSRLKRIDAGLDLLYKRLSQDLGEDRALHFMARTSLDIIFAYR